MSKNTKTMALVEILTHEQCSEVLRICETETEWQMAIRTKQPGDRPMTRRQMKIDQAWEMAALARQDGDKADEQRWYKEVERLKQLPDE